MAAYDAKGDRFLILDVARYKYPPVWIGVADLFDAMRRPIFSCTWRLYGDAALPS